MCYANNFQRAVSSFRNIKIFSFSQFYIILHLTFLSLGWQNKQLEDVTLGYGNMRLSEIN